MDLDIERRAADGVVLLDIKGRLVAGGASNVLREAIAQETRDGHVRVVLNLQGVESIDSTGLGTLVICFTALRKAGGALKLLHLNRRNIELLVLTKLSTVFEVYQEEQDAVNSFYPERRVQPFDILQFVQANKEHEEE